MFDESPFDEAEYDTSGSVQQEPAGATAPVTTRTRITMLASGRTHTQLEDDN